MIRSTEEADLELKVLDREHRFVDGLCWRLQEALQQLRREERQLLGRLGADASFSSGPSSEQEPLPIGNESASASSSAPSAVDGRGVVADEVCPQTPPLRPYLALDPLQCGAAGALAPPLVPLWRLNREELPSPSAACPSPDESAVEDEEEQEEHEQQQQQQPQGFEAEESVVAVQRTEEAANLEAQEALSMEKALLCAQAHLCGASPLTPSTATPLDDSEDEDQFEAINFNNHRPSSLPSQEDPFAVEASWSIPLPEHGRRFVAKDRYGLEETPSVDGSETPSEDDDSESADGSADFGGLASFSLASLASSRRPRKRRSPPLLQEDMLKKRAKVEPLLHGSGGKKFGTIRKRPRRAQLQARVHTGSAVQA